MITFLHLVIICSSFCQFVIRSNGSSNDREGVEQKPVEKVGSTQDPEQQKEESRECPRDDGIVTAVRFQF